MIYVGIDPDIEKNGVAVVDTDTHEVTVGKKSFVELFRFLQHFGTEHGVIVIEASWLTTHNWHFRPTDSRRKVAALGHAVGRNHQTGILIGEMAKELGYNVRYQTPLKKYWQGADGKITHKEITSFMPIKQGRTNQEERDAALIAWVYAGLPVKIKTKLK